jgi:hypothetical protein
VEHIESFPIVGSSSITSTMQVIKMGMEECMIEDGEWIRGDLRGREKDYLNKIPLILPKMA